MKCPLEPVKGYLVCVFPEGSLPEFVKQTPIPGKPDVYKRNNEGMVVAEEFIQKEMAQDRSDYVKDGKELIVIAENSENYDFKVGDKILMQNFTGAQPIMRDGVEYVFVRDMYVLCKIK